MAQQPPASPAEHHTPEPTTEKPDAENGGFPDWEDDPENPYNWASWRKIVLVTMLSMELMTASIATSIVSPAVSQLREKYHVSSTVSLLPVSLYTVALAFGPVLGGPLSETIGRYPIYLGGMFCGAMFTLGAALTDSFAALCVLRFLAGFCWAPCLAMAPGSLTETFRPAKRGPVSAVTILMPFLGPGLGPVIGAFCTTRKNYRWTQYTLLFFAITCLILAAFSQESYHTIIMARVAKKRGQAPPTRPPWTARMRMFLVIALVRPIRMLILDPITAFVSLYVAVEFGTLFSFFAAVPYTFTKVYQFSIDDYGLVFLAIVIGCLFGLVTLLACDRLLYRRQIPNYPPNRIPPEYRLYPALMGSVGLPLGLFWHAWTARQSIHWMSPTAAIVPFAWGNICLFVACVQFIADTYHGSIVASAASANSLARYALAAAFPLFTIQMYERLGIHWAGSLLGFLALALMPVPWVLFRFGPQIRAKSVYETIDYTAAIKTIS